MRDFFLLGGAQAAQYLILTINFRAIAHAQYAAAGTTAALAAVLAYFIVRRVVHDDSRWGLAGMISGGALADMAGIWLTRSWG